MRQESMAVTVEKTYTNSIGMEFVLIPSGSFMMGSKEGYDDERPQHRVTISRPFYLGTYEVTQEQWETVMGNNPSWFKGRSNPVEKVSWLDAQDFIKRLNAKEGHNRYRLPTEAEWEYAARAGTSSAYSFGDGKNELSSYGWYGDNSGETTHPVGQKKPNPWGLYDVHGNVYEWVQDWYGETYYANSLGTTPMGPPDEIFRVVRGGSWEHTANRCRSADRDGYRADRRSITVGFRLARSPGRPMMIQTSENDPLHIDVLPLADGFIGMVNCPGGYVPDARSGICERSLEADLRVIQAWGAQVVVTLMEDWEIADLKVTGIKDIVPNYGMSWWHLPVKDAFPLEYPGDGSTEASVDRWSAACALLRVFLHKGGKVLIHCTDGLGRTGTLAARLLIENGVARETAIREVRRARPGAVETEAQEKYVYDFPLRDLSSFSQYELDASAVDLIQTPEVFSLEVWEKYLRDPAVQSLPVTHTNSIGMELVLIPAGSFLLKRTMLFDNDYGANLHKVTISKPFYLGKQLVTQDQWKAVMGNNPSRWACPTDPVRCVSWEDAQEFIERMNTREGHTRYRLPTEMEWEYVARSTEPDALEFDHWILGGPDVWMLDWFGEIPESRQITDYRGPDTGKERTVRGMACGSLVLYGCRVFRIGRMPDFRDEHTSFRLALSPE